jgi:2'-hydroxyisoflavone reductase
MKVLILGGTEFLGRDLVEVLKEQSCYNVVLANRNITNKNLFPDIPRIIIDRNDKHKCESLKNFLFDVVIDFSCYTAEQFINTHVNLNYKRYIYISTTSVLIPNIERQLDLKDPFMQYAWDKFTVEEYIKKHTTDCLIIRPCSVYGRYDNTGRFGHRVDGTYFWKKTKKDVGSESVNVRSVTNIIIRNIISEPFESSIINICG